MNKKQLTMKTMADFPVNTDQTSFETACNHCGFHICNCLLEGTIAKIIDADCAKSMIGRKVRLLRTCKYRGNSGWVITYLDGPYAGYDDTYSANHLVKMLTNS